MLLSAEGNNVRNAVSAAKKLIGKPQLRIASMSGGDDGLYRVILNSGDVVEVTLKFRARCSAIVLEK